MAARSFLPAWAGAGINVGRRHRSAARAARKLVRCVVTCADASTAFVFAGQQKLQILCWGSGVLVASLQDARVDHLVPFCSSLVDSGGEGTNGTLFVGYNDGTVAEWSVATRTCTAIRVTGGGGRTGVNAISARASAGSTRSGGDGDHGVELVTGHHDGAVRVWSAGGCGADEGGVAVGAAAEPTSGGMSGVDLVGSRFNVRCWAVTADGAQLISGSREGLAGVWDVKLCACVATLGSEGSWEMKPRVAVSSDGSVIALGRREKGALLWTCRAGNWGVAVVLDSGRRINCVALSSDGRLVVTGDDSGGVFAWDAHSGTLLRRFSDRTGSAIASVALTEMPRVRSEDDSAEGGDNGGTGVTWCCFMRPKQIRTPAQPRFVASRDADWRCCLWTLDSAEVVDEQLGVDSHRGLGDVFETTARGVDPSKWREYWSQDARDSFWFRLSPGALSSEHKCVVKTKALERKLEVTLDSPSCKDPCSCVARVQFDLDLNLESLLAFERQLRGEGDASLVACCGFWHGGLALLDVHERRD
jgi:WD40 repeat protein